ncbi:hypothetical protein GDO86_018971 [Hymenochirus boettgeri]|uniref:Glutathione peroxidase n=1 Tax=Hymenochirus boettgeri TaxID=247094 RepID=A0A8T2IAB9_9PIPI|nr:hypothetical protein GDO86_018972 [Hymenochirus boettgeri]KAG8428892.1 hypothetical protein GDO86_018971 [Hymenochirus boettgeri]
MVQPCMVLYVVCTEPPPQVVDCYSNVEGSIYDYEAVTLDGSRLISFKQYEGKMVLFVNVATF